VDPFEVFIDLEEETAGDFSCFSGGEWMVDSPSIVDETAVIELDVLDFETDVPVKKATADFWYNDVVSGAPDQTGTSDDSGRLAIELPVCQPVSYKVQGDPLQDETKETYEAHQIFEAGVPESLNSVSITTYLVIPSILGINVDADLGIIAGTAIDCAGEEIVGSQVIVRDDAGNIVEDAIVRYFVENFPSRDQPYTSEDGLWVAVNVPAGQLTVELWAVVEGELTQVGATELVSYPDSINISNIYTGYADGRKYPVSCL
jgi:hypothetical protein